jgi:hypothetical protein
VLSLNALSPGETKKIELTVEAMAYSIGAADHPDVRVWVKHVDDFYEKADFGSAFNNVGGYQTFNGGDLATYSQSDVLAAEECNGVDDNCDGTTDEGCGPDTGAGDDAGPGGGGPGADAESPGPADPAAAGRDFVGGCGVGGAGASPAALLLLALSGAWARRRPVAAARRKRAAPSVWG